MRKILSIIGPGLLVAATGVGAGDLATGGFAGSQLGVAVLWAVAVGALLKFGLSEGLTRWQLVTGETLLAGSIGRLGPWLGWLFLLYLLPWSYFTGAALISASGVATAAILPWIDDPTHAKLVYGALLSAGGALLAWRGGYAVVEKVMAAFIAVMFVAVIGTACLVLPPPGEILRGLFWPSIPQLHEGGLTWTVALIGGVGGTVTILCYGYWIREKGRRTTAELRTCRIDLVVGYGATALFGMAMLIIARDLSLDGGGVSLIVGLADQLEARLGSAGRWVFLIGAWAAIASSLLGVWQAVPYLFADVWLRLRRSGAIDTDARSLTATVAYRVYLIALAIVPLLQVSLPFREVQKAYAVIGAAFLPLLALLLLAMNGRAAWVGRYRNGPAAVGLLIGALVLSAAAGWAKLTSG